MPPSTTESAGACIELTSVELAGLVTWPAVVTAQWDDALRAVGELGVGGVLLMAPEPDVDEAELTDLLSQLDAASALGVLVATDEEGGTVQRLRHLAPLASQREVSEQLSPAQAQALITEHGAVVRRVGVDIVLGPVVDVEPIDGDSALDRSRFFAGAPSDVTEYAAAYIAGWQANGLMPTLKHFPGHGAASADTHDAIGVTPPIEELESRDLVPYRTIGEQGVAPLAVMVGHLTVPGLTGDSPASLSSSAISHLREIDGFGDALVISDALEMGAVGLPVAAAAVAAIGAGVDVALFADSAAAEGVVQAIASAIDDGTIARSRILEASRRVLDALGRVSPCLVS